MAKGVATAGKKLGRPSGKSGSSFVVVKLKHLTAVLKEEANVLVSRKYAEALILEAEGTMTKNNGTHLVGLKDQLKAQD